MPDKLQDKLLILKKGYLKKLEGLILAFKDILSNSAKIDIDDLYTKIHNISGTSGVYGLKELSELATDFEFYLKEIKNNPIKNESELRDKLNKFITETEKTVTEGV